MPISRASRLVLVAVALAPLAAASSSWGELSFFTPAPCYYACPGIVCDSWIDCPAATPGVTFEAACAPSPVAVPGSYDDETIAIGGATRVLSVHVNAPPPLAGFQLYACRTTPDAQGRHLVAVRWSGVCGDQDPTRDGVCEPIGGGQFAHLRLDVTALRGETLLVRVYNEFAAFQPYGLWEQT